MKKNEITGKTVDINPLLKQAGITAKKTTILETGGMYPYKEKVEDNWAYFTAVGCKKLKEQFDKEGKTIRDVGIVGICSGVEAIALILIFKEDLHHVIVTDIDADILKGTMYNITNTVHPTCKITSLVGSFCEPIEKKGFHVDVVHANIPNLPSTGKENLTKGAEKGTFLKSELYEKYQPPQKFVKWAMAAQYAYLQSAKKVLNKGGSVITELGGRMPLQLVNSLFEECGLQLQEILVGFKEQTEARIDFEGYARLEKEFGVTFDFYRYEESRNALEEKNISNPTRAVTGEKMKELLNKHKVTAQEALHLHKRGIAVGHTVHLFRGIK